MHYDTWSRYKIPSTLTWGSGGNTCVITDGKIRPNSVVIMQVTGATPAAGNWSYDYTVGGQLTITSSNSESSSLPMAYVTI